MLIRDSRLDIPSSEITPRGIYLNRRALMSAGAGLIAAGAFARIAGAIAATGRRLLVVQEGGYLSEDLGPNLTAFLSGLQG